MSEKKRVISQHLFLFPFVIKTTDRSRPFCRKEIRKALEKEGWKWEKFSPEKNFSEFVYFHNYVRESAFNREEQKDSFADFYQKSASLQDSLLLYWGEKEDSEFYRLPIEFISLHIFETGIGILTIELLNYDYPNFDDVLKINDLARRVYPQYLTNDNQDKQDEPPKGKLLPYRVSLSLSGNRTTELFQGPFVSQNGEIVLAAHIRSLLGTSFLETHMIEPVIDDRMYTLCWYENDEFSKLMKVRNRRSYAYEDSDDWYRFVFVDGDDSCCKNIDMRRDLIRKATYARWVEYGTLFGISRYSFVALTERSVFSYGVVRNHMQRQYFQIAIFLLAQRASAISFASRISSISTEIDNIKSKAGEIEAVAEKVGKLQGDFIGFVNRLWFEEVTPQEQGIELFEIAQHQMKLKEQIAELKEEMKELFEFVELQYDKMRIQRQEAQTLEDSKLNKTVSKLTIIAGICMPLTLLVGAWGMNFQFTTNQSWIGLLVTFILTVVISLFLYRWAKKEES